MTYSPSACSLRDPPLPNGAELLNGALGGGGGGSPIQSWQRWGGSLGSGCGMSARRTCLHMALGGSPAPEQSVTAPPPRLNPDAAFGAGWRTASRHPPPQRTKQPWPRTVGGNAGVPGHVRAPRHNGLMVSALIPLRETPGTARRLAQVCRVSPFSPWHSRCSIPGNRTRKSSAPTAAQVVMIRGVLIVVLGVLGFIFA